MSKNEHDWLNAHGDYLYRFALGRLRDPHLAEDVVQETFLAAIKSPNFSEQSAPRTWLTGILKHKIIDLIRKQSKEQSVEDVEQVALENANFNVAGMDDFFDDNGHWTDKPQTWDIPDNALEQKQFLAILQNCMDKLPKKLANLFLLRDVLEDDNEQICKELDISSTNAWVMLYRARMGLRKCLEINWLT